MLRFCRLKICSDHRDKSYGALGTVPDCVEEIKLKYQHSLDKIHGQLVRYLLEQQPIALVLVNSRMGKVASVDTSLIGLAIDAD